MLWSKARSRSLDMQDTAAFGFRTLEITTFEPENAASNLRNVLVAQLDPVTFGWGKRR